MVLFWGENIERENMVRKDWNDATHLFSERLIMLYGLRKEILELQDMVNKILVITKNNSCHDDIGQTPHE